MPLSDPRKLFEKMGCSHFHMSRDDPSKYAQYVALEISKEQEHAWRRERIDAVAKKLSVAVTAKWQSFTELVGLCEYQGDVDSLKLLYRTAEVVRDKLPPLGCLIVAESLIGRSIYHYDCGVVYFAVRLNRKSFARHFVAIAQVLAERAKKRRCDPSRVDANIKRCIAVAEHFKL